MHQTEHFNAPGNAEERRPLIVEPTTEAAQGRRGNARGRPPAEHIDASPPLPHKVENANPDEAQKDEVPPSVPRQTRSNGPLSGTTIISGETAKVRTRQASSKDVLFTKYRKLAKIQNKFFTLQTTLKVERDKLQANSRSLTASQNQLKDSLSTSRSSKKRRSSREKKSRDAYDRSVAEHSAFQRQLQRVNDLEQDLSKLEFKLAKQQPELLQIVVNYFSTDALEGLDEVPEELQSPSRPSSPQLHPLELGYYDQRGYFRRLRDELLDLCNEEVQEGTEAYQQMTPDVNEEIDRRTTEWQLEYDLLLQKLELAEHDLREKWSECQALGLDVGPLSSEIRMTPEHSAQLDPFDIPSEIGLDLPPFLQQDRRGALPSFLRGFQWSQRPVQSESSTKMAGKHNEIESWMSRLPFTTQTPSGVDYEPLAEMEHVISASRSEPTWYFVDPVCKDDFVWVPNNEAESAANGRGINSGIQRVIRKCKSLGLLTIGARRHSAPLLTDSFNISAPTDPRQLRVPANDFRPSSF